MPTMGFALKLFFKIWNWSSEGIFPDLEFLSENLKKTKQKKNNNNGTGPFMGIWFLKVKKKTHTKNIIVSNLYAKKRLVQCFTG